MRTARRVVTMAATVLLVLGLGACSTGTGAGNAIATSTVSADETATANQTDEEASTMQVQVNGATFQATFADTQAAEEFRKMLPLTVDATELNGNEKYAQLDQSLSMDGASVVSPIQAGDIFLYAGNDVVLFYETHDNASWSYVPLAHIDDASGLAEAVGTGGVTITYSL